MKRDLHDYHYVPDDQISTHERLVNWARWVRPGLHFNQAAIWKLGKPPASARDGGTPVDQIDAQRIEMAVRDLPVKHRDALRWAYVWRDGPTKARKRIGVTAEALAALVRDGRTMLANRSYPIRAS